MGRMHYIFTYIITSLIWSRLINETTVLLTPYSACNDLSQSHFSRVECLLWWNYMTRLVLISIGLPLIRRFQARFDQPTRHALVWSSVFMILSSVGEMVELAGFSSGLVYIGVLLAWMSYRNRMNSS